MRTINMTIEGDALIPSDYLAGQTGEHQDTALTLTLPEEWAGCACTFRFYITSQNKHYQTMPLTDPVSFLLPQALMVAGKLLVYLDAREGYTVHRTEPATLRVEDSPDWCGAVGLAPDPYEGLIEASLQDFAGALDELHTDIGDVSQLRDDMTAMASQVTADKSLAEAAASQAKTDAQEVNRQAQEVTAAHTDVQTWAAQVSADKAVAQTAANTAKDDAQSALESRNIVEAAAAQVQTNADLVTQNTEAVTEAAAQVAQDKAAVEEASADVSREIADFNGKLDAGAVSADMVEFLDLSKPSENLFDPSQPIASGQVYGESGQLTANANYDSTTEHIYAGHVAGHTVYASDSIRTLLEYDESRQLLAHTAYVNGAVGKQLTANTQYLKISIPAGQAEQFVVRADSPVTEYIPYQNTYTLSDEVDISPSVAKDISEPIGCGMNVLAPDLSWDTGILTDTGASNPSYNAYKSSGYIPVKPSQVYTIYHWDESRQACILSAIRAYCFYGAGKEFVSGWSQGSNLPYQIQTPADCCYLRISVPAVNLPKVFLAEGNYKQNAIPEYQEAQRIAPTFLTPAPTFANKLQGKTILGLGDSITQADGCEAGWIMRTANNLGMVGVNEGINGSTIAVKESSPTDRDPMVTRYPDMPDADVVVVLGGSNDWFYAWTPIGEFADRTNYTFYGALHNLILGLMQKYADSLIVFATPIKRGNAADLTNSNGKTLDDYCDIIREVCAYYGVAVLDCNRDVQLAPFIPWQNNKYFLTMSGQEDADYTHPNDLGHTKIAAYITGQIKALVP